VVTGEIMKIVESTSPNTVDKDGKTEFDPAKPSQFMKFVISEIQSEYGVPTYSGANLLAFRRIVHKSIRQFRPDIRGTHLQILSDRILPALFIPTEEHIALSEAMSDQRTSWLKNLFRWSVTGEDQLTETLHEKKSRLVRPSD
jgi:hypothetical protein